MPITLIGVINTGYVETSLAVFGPKPTYAHVGDQVGGMTLDQIVPRGVYLRQGEQRFLLWSGTGLDGDAPVQIRQGVEFDGDHITVARDLRDYVVKQGLLRVLMQAASSQEAAPDGTVLGYSLWDIEPGSVFEMAGFQNGDMVTEIDQVATVNPFVTLKLLSGLKDEDQFSFAFVRDGVRHMRNVTIK